MGYIIDLQEVSLNNWRAQYQGNFGIYTINATLEGKRIVNFSCNCPSKHSPCKHYSIIKEALLNQLDNNRPATIKNETPIEELLSGVSREELYRFFIRQAKLIPQLSQAILLEFSNKPIG